MTHPTPNTLEQTVWQFLSRTGVTKDTRLLLGVSGGMDSMVLLTIAYQLNYNIAVSHINFNLRGAESDEDAAFIRDWCKERSIPFYILNKITKTIEAELGINTQAAARKIRYDWWDKLAQKHNFEFVCTGHHLDDSIETFLLNLFRGSGIKGLRGIPQKRGIYLRPMLDIAHTDILSYAEQNNVPFRTDSSNLGDDYQRNKLRHHLLPIIREMYPGIHSSMRKTISRINTEWKTLDHKYHEWVESNVESIHDGVAIQQTMANNAFLLRWLEEKGFPWPLISDFIQSNTQDSGHYIEHNHQRLSRTDTGYFLETIQAPFRLSIQQPGRYSLGKGLIIVEELPEDEQMNFDDPLTAFINDDAISWPLIIRNVQDGDLFQPYGMKGKHKKLQDFMVDLKLEIFEKKRLLILENGDHILWVIGKRLDERASVTDQTKKIFKVRYLPEVEA